MNSIKELLNFLFRKEKNDPMVLDDRIEFRLNKNEKVLIKKYCELKRVSVSDFFRSLAIKDINTFFNINADEVEEAKKIIIFNEKKKSQYKNRIIG